MTLIRPGRPLRRQTAALCSHLPIVVELHPKHLTLRLKGQRKPYDLSYERLIWIAFRQGADSELRERNLARTLRRAC